MSISYPLDFKEVIFRVLLIPIILSRITFEVYSGLGSHTQHIESSVKDGNHCGTIGRAETHQTHLVIHRSGLVTKIREMTRKIGEEVHRQKTGRGYNEKNHKIKCRGS